MKKRYILPMLALAISLVCANNMKTTEYKVKAEEESSLVEEFVSKEYRYYEDDTHYAVLTLLTENDFHAFVVNGEEQYEINGNYFLDGDICTLFYQGNTMKVQLTTEGAFKEYVEFNPDAGEGGNENGLQEEEQGQEEVLEGVKKEVEEWFKNQYDTFVLPLISGLSITSVVGLVVSLVLAYLNRRNNNNNKVTIAELTDTSKNVLVFATELLKTIQNNAEISEETRKLFEETTDDLVDKLGRLTDKTEKLLEVKNHLYTIASLLNEIASNTKEFVANGVAEKCNKLLEEIENI